MEIIFASQPGQTVLPSEIKRGMAIGSPAWYVAQSDARTEGDEVHVDIQWADGDTGVRAWPAAHQIDLPLSASADDLPNWMRS